MDNSFVVFADYHFMCLATQKFSLEQTCQESKIRNWYSSGNPFKCILTLPPDMLLTLCVMVQLWITYSWIYFLLCFLPSANHFFLVDGAKNTLFTRAFSQFHLFLELMVVTGTHQEAQCNRRVKIQVSNWFCGITSIASAFDSDKILKQEIEIFLVKFAAIHKFWMLFWISLATLWLADMGVPQTDTEFCVPQTEIRGSHHFSIFFFPVQLIFCLQSTGRKQGWEGCILLSPFFWVAPGNVISSCHWWLLIFCTFSFPSRHKVGSVSSFHADFLHSFQVLYIGFAWPDFGRREATRGGSCGKLLEASPISHSLGASWTLHWPRLSPSGVVVTPLG